MWQWILIVALYAFGMGFFRLLGGVGAASEALRRWGTHESGRRRARIEAFQRGLRRQA